MSKPVKRSALGRGLDTILPPTASEIQVEEARLEASAVQEIPLHQIETNPYQPRTEFEAEALQELADSVRTHGIIQPITVRRLSATEYQLISGERRTRAARMAGLDSIPAYIRTADDQQMLAFALIENIQREELNPIETALGYQRLIDECSLTIEQAGEQMGKKRATVNNYLRLLRLPANIQKALRDRQLSMGHARALITVDNPEVLQQLFEAIVGEGLSVREVERRVADIGRPQPTAETPGSVSAKPEAKADTPFDIQLRSVTRELEQHFNTRVQIQHKTTGEGEIRLRYFSQDDLNRLLDLLNPTH
jgi:ParB family chromosome partitioning protein